ncbi:hypothetical protein K469DRAFT_67865 [Zopfia rhizophila CBS 207.26]|uniref:Uncharacterized protein n=1 Tax=Zopfia rhizophila CBS 207.26 TaxID=1314779 RepID=A0A6A6D7D8_9PEZI|nr:hypothetical protein K469DRAFT_67865 [Zopfia rhizophila CBS 207.26]
MCFVDENRGDRQETIDRRRSSGEDQQEDHKEDQQENSVYKQWSYLRGQHSVTLAMSMNVKPARNEVGGEGVRTSSNVYRSEGERA